MNSSLLRRVIRGYLWSLRALLGGCMVLIVGVMMAQVLARYLVGGSLIWAEELCRYLLIWMTFLGLGVAYSRGDFVALDFLPNVLSPRWAWVLRAVMAVPVLGFLLLMAWHGYDFASRFDRQTIPALDFIWESLTGGPLGLSIRYVYVSVTVGLGLLAGHVIADLIVRFGPQMRRNETYLAQVAAAGES